MMLTGTSGGTLATGYQWQLNGTNVAAATNGWLMLNDAQSGQGGVYTLIVTGSQGVITNSVATLTVNPVAPLITQQPQGSVVQPGATTTLSVRIAPGTEPFSCQWQFNGSNLPGASASTLTLTNLQAGDGGSYRVVVSNPVDTATSADAIVAVVPMIAWGWNSLSQTNVVPSATNVVAIAGGDQFSLALRADGSVVGWGDSRHGQCQVPAGLANVVAIAAGEQFSLALCSDGTVVGWGDNGGGQTNIPTAVTNILAVAVGGYHAVALRADGQVFAWGDNTHGQCKVPSSATNVVALANIVGGVHSLALRSDGTVFAWGDNTWGQCNVPPNATNVVAIAGGWGDSLALRADGTVVAWGSIGAPPSGLSNVVAIACGNWHCLALRADGTVAAWGDNGFNESVVRPGTTNIVAIAAGRLHSILLLDQSLVASPLFRQKCIGNSFQACVMTYAVKSYELQYEDSLSDSNWSSLPSVRGNGRIMVLSDTNACVSHRFYRVRQR
jgi:hypothetical protein